jgi:hypothetical protein
MSQSRLSFSKRLAIGNLIYQYQYLSPGAMHPGDAKARATGSTHAERRINTIEVMHRRPQMRDWAPMHDSAQERARFQRFGIKVRTGASDPLTGIWLGNLGRNANSCNFFAILRT